MKYTLKTTPFVHYFDMGCADDVAAMRRTDVPNLPANPPMVDGSTPPQLVVCNGRLCEAICYAPGQLRTVGETLSIDSNMWVLRELTLEAT